MRYLSLKKDRDWPLWASLCLSSVISLRDQSGMYSSERMGSGLLGCDPLSLGWCLSTFLRNVIPSSVRPTPEDEFCSGRRNNLTLTLRSAEM